MDLKLLRGIESHFGKKAVKVEDKGKFYKIDFSNKTTMTIFKPEELSKDLAEIHKKEIETLSKCSTKTLKEIKDLCESNIENEPLVSLYLDRSYELAYLIERAYKEIGKSNSFHFFIKEISPEIYGRAQTFLNRVTELHSLLEEVLSFKKNETLEKRSKLKVIGGKK